MSQMRPDKDVLVFLTGMLMDGSLREYVFGFSTTGMTIPYAPALYNQYMEPVISQPILSTQNVERPTFGNIILQNDGRLNHLLKYSFGDRLIEVFMIREQDYDSRSLLFSGLIDQVVIGHQVEVVVKDSLSLLDTGAVNGTFSGENILPYGIEGDRDLEGQTKPRLFGKCFNASPVLVNSAKLIYGMNWDQEGNTAPLYAVTEVRDKGAILPVEADVATAALLQEVTVTHGYVQTCLAEGLMRLGSPPAGTVTADAASHEVSGITEVIYDIALEAGFTPAQLRLLDNCDCPVGVYADSGTSYRDITDSILLPLDSFLWVDSVTNLRIGTLEVLPGAEEKLFFIGHRESPLPEEHIPIISASVIGQTYPVYRLTFNYYPNLTIQGPDELVWASRLQWGKFAYPWSTFEDDRQYVKEVFQEARQETRDTAIHCDIGVEDRATRLLDRVQYPHQLVRVRMNLSDNFVVPLVDLIDDTHPVTMDSTVTTMDSTLIQMDRTVALITYLPNDETVLLGDIVGLQSPYVPDCDNVFYQVREVETNVRTNEVNLVLEGKIGTVVFRGITPPEIIGVSPEEFCFKEPPPALHASAFSTIDLGEPHVSSDWQIAEDRYFYLLKDQVLKDPVQLTTWQPTRNLLPDTIYYARVRYRTATYRSRWTDPFQFTLRHMVQTPAITSPDEGDEFLYPNDMPITVTTDAFVPKIAGLTHYSTYWLFRNLATGVTMAFDDDTVNLTSYDVNLRPGRIRISVRYKADTGCFSAWGTRNIEVINGPCEGSGGIMPPVETLPLNGDLITS